MTHSSLATAADYADALLTARRAKNWLFLLLLLMILAQLILFFVARYGNGLTPRRLATVARIETVENVNVEITSTQPSGIPTTQHATVPAKRTDAVVASTRTDDILHYLVAASVFLGLTLSIVLAVALLLIVIIMLVGRLIGVSRVTSAFIWCIVLCVLLFPWQAFLPDQTTGPDFKIPGVLYTWNELTSDFNFSTEPISFAILKWARFVGFPIVALIILLMIQARSNRGLRLALGESQDEIIDAAPTV
jgi:hypothetical protein